MTGYQWAGAGGSGASGSGASGRVPAGPDSGSAMMVAMGELILLRHGETEWSRAGRHTGRTDIPLTPAGEAAAASLAPALAGRDIAAVFTSPAQRAVRTAELAGLDGAKPDPDLQEWDYGGYEGMTTAQIRAARPGWYLWRDGVRPGDARAPRGDCRPEVGARAGRGAGPGAATAAPRGTWCWSRTRTCCAC